MQLFRKFFLFTLLWLMAFVAHAQQILPFSQHIETGSRTVFCIFQDADGIWWFGTSQGLFTSAQLVGNSNHVYSRHPELENNIVQIQQDNTGRLWLMTQANKYMIYNPRTNELIADVEKYLQQMNIKMWYDFRTHIDKEGKVWLYKERELYVHDFRSQLTRHVTLPASSGNIIGVASTWERCVVLTEKAAYLTPAAMNRIRPVFLTRTPEVFQYDQVLCELTGKGDLWVYANLHLYTYFASNKTWRQRTEIVPDVKSFLLLPDDRFYVSTSNTGIYAYDSKGELITHMFQSLPLVNGLVNNHIQTMYYDPQSRMVAVAYHKHDITLFLADSRELCEHYVQWGGQSLSCGGHHQFRSCRRRDGMVGNRGQWSLQGQVGRFRQNHREPIPQVSHYGSDERPSGQTMDRSLSWRIALQRRQKIFCRRVALLYFRGVVPPAHRTA